MIAEETYSSLPMYAYAWGDPHVDLENPRFVISVEWTWPANDWTHFSLVRSTRSGVRRREEGQVMMTTKGKEWDQFAYQTTGLPVYRDPQPPPGEWVYYTAFVLDRNRIWKYAGEVFEVSIEDYNWALQLPELLPGVAIADLQRTASPAEQSNTLVSFLQPPGALLDKVVTMGEAAQYFWDPLRVPPQMLQSLTESVGYDWDESLGGQRWRWVLNALMGPRQGSLPSIRNFTAGATGCDARVEISNNLMLDVNDSSFENGTLVGAKWLPAANIELRKYEDIYDKPPTLHPNVQVFWYLYLRAAGTYTCGPNYTGTAQNQMVVEQGIPCAEWTMARMGLHAYAPSPTPVVSISMGLKMYNHVGQYLRDLTVMQPTNIIDEWRWYSSPAAGKEFSTGDPSDLLRTANWWVDAASASGGTLVDWSGQGRHGVLGAAAAAPLVLPHTGLDYLTVYTGTANQNYIDGITPNVPATATLIWTIETTGTLSGGNFLLMHAGSTNGEVQVFITSAGAFYVNTWVGGVVKSAFWNGVVTVNNRKTYRVQLTTTGAELFVNDVSQTLKTFGATRVPAVNTTSTMLMADAITTPSWYRIYDFNLYGGLIFDPKNATASKLTVTNTGSSAGTWTIKRPTSGYKAAIVDRQMLLFGGSQTLNAPLTGQRVRTRVLLWREYGQQSTATSLLAGDGNVSTATGGGILLATDGTYTGRVALDVGTYLSPAGTSAMALDGERFVALTIASGEAVLYLDGVKTAVPATVADTFLAPVVSGAAYNVLGMGAAGEFIAAATWDRVLTDEEIAEVRQELISGNGPGFAYAVPWVTVSNPCSVDLIVVDDG